MKSSVSVEARLREVNFRPSGFDYLRIILSCSVVAYHSFVICYGMPAHLKMWASPFGAFGRLIVPMFFSLSGFLVAGSLQRSKTLVGFLSLRVIRIYPALMVECLLSACLIGPALTQLNRRRYFADPIFWGYLQNCLGYVHFHLPGLFLNNPNPGMVNVQRWTVPYELMCYLSLAALAVSGVLRWRFLCPIAATTLILAFGLHHFFRYGVLVTPVQPQGILMVSAFLFGVSAFLYKEELPLNKYLGISLTIVALIVGYVAPRREFGYAILIIPPVCAYITIFWGTMNPKKVFIVRGADYSYGIYLYGFVMQQCTWLLLPFAREWYSRAVSGRSESAGFPNQRRGD